MLAFFPFAVWTVIVTVPFFTPFTMPLPLTVAMAGSELLQLSALVIPEGLSLTFFDRFSFFPFFKL